ncbi:MAG: hypothetical protein Q4D29_09125 [Lachnospiraceae bacterium]|nr:hypothetical protein [Lachnospiraceae bacterium]
MKYCMKCGTLLEDSHDRCIGCGSDVTEPGSWSLYPPDMAKTIEIEEKEKKSRTGLIIAMVVIFVLLVAAIAVFILMNMNRVNEAVIEPQTEEQVEEAVVEEVAEEPVEEEPEQSGLKPIELAESEADTSESADTAGEQEIKDANGSYYTIGTVSDAASNVIFNTIYPEDFEEKVSNVNYDVYSNRYPETITYIVGNKDGNVQLTYMSPQHFWYRKSDYKGQTRSNERDVEDYMQFLTYDGAQSYIEALIKQSYTDIKSFKLIDKEEFSPEISETINKVSADHTTELLGDIGDYAKIASDTVYAAMQAECEADIYHYEATSRQENIIYMDFYVPVIANTLDYVSEMESDKGEITEWLVPEFIAFEAGNEELHNKYMDAFKMFIYNSKLTKEFFYINDAYSKDIEEAVKIKREPARLSADKLKTFHSKYSASAEINAFGNGVYSLLNTMPSGCSSFSGEKSIIGLENAKVGYYSKDKNKVFISTVEDEYPGSDYTKLDYKEGSAGDSSESSEDSSDSE